MKFSVKINILKKNINFCKWSVDMEKNIYDGDSR